MATSRHLKLQHSTINPTHEYTIAFLSEAMSLASAPLYTHSQPALLNYERLFMAGWQLSRSLTISFCEFKIYMLYITCGKVVMSTDVTCIKVTSSIYTDISSKQIHYLYRYIIYTNPFSLDRVNLSSREEHMLNLLSRLLVYAAIFFPRMR